MKVNAVDNKNSIICKGLTKPMSKQVFVDGKKDILAFLSQSEHKNTNLGMLPPCIFYKLKSSSLNLREAIKEVYSVFEECAKEIREFTPSIKGDPTEYKNRRMNSTVDKMRNILTKYAVIEKPEDFDLVYLDMGQYKGAYKMVGLKDEKTGDVPCFKIFHVTDTTPEWHKYKCHGNYAELNSAVYWQKSEGNYSNINRFYCGDINSGYLIDRYVDLKLTPEPKKFACMYDYGTKNTDAFCGGNGHNILNNYLFDQGGYRVINRVKNKSKTARYVLKQLKESPDNMRWQKWNEILYSQNYNKLDDEQKKAGLALAIKHLAPKQQIQAIDTCLGFNMPLVDMALGYALKYMPYEDTLTYFQTLLKRKNPEVQTVVLNEIPLLSTKDKNRFDDINTPRHKVEPIKVYKYYQIAKQYVLPETKEHLASYVHLLPKNQFREEVGKLINENDYAINDRLLHKIRFEPLNVENSSADEYTYNERLEVLSKIQMTTKDPFIRKKAGLVRKEITQIYNDDGN